MAQKLPAKVQIKSPICTILLSKSEFSFALLLVTFEPHEVEQSYIPHLKALMCGINAAEAVLTVNRNVAVLKKKMRLKLIIMKQLHFSTRRRYLL